MIISAGDPSISPPTIYPGRATFDGFGRNQKFTIEPPVGRQRRRKYTIPEQNIATVKYNNNNDNYTSNMYKVVLALLSGRRGRHSSTPLPPPPPPEDCAVYARARSHGVRRTGHTAHSDRLESSAAFRFVYTVPPQRTRAKKGEKIKTNARGEIKYKKKKSTHKEINKFSTAARSRFGDLARPPVVGENSISRNYTVMIRIGSVLAAFRSFMRFCYYFC